MYYPDWDDLYEAVRRALAGPALSEAATELLLFAIARDNEAELILGELDDHPEHGLALAEAAMRASESDARWQLAVFLGRQPGQRYQALLRRYLDDTDEYVRRCALIAAAAYDRDHAEQVAWSRLTDPHEYTRLAAFSVLRDVRSGRLGDATVLLRDDPSEWVRAEVTKVEGSAQEGPG